MSFVRKDKEGILARFEKLRAQNRIPHEKAHEVAHLAYRYIKRGTNCAIVVPDMNGVEVVMAAISSREYVKKYKVISHTDEKFIFEYQGNPENKVEIRVFPKAIESNIPIILGDNVKILDAREGDPDMDALNDLMGWG